MDHDIGVCLQPFWFAGSQVHTPHCIKKVGDVRMGALKETPGLSKGRKRSWTQEPPGNASPLGSIEIFNLKH